MDAMKQKLTKNGFPLAQGLYDRLTSMMRAVLALWRTCVALESRDHPQGNPGVD